VACSLGQEAPERRQQRATELEPLAVSIVVFLGFVSRDVGNGNFTHYNPRPALWTLCASDPTSLSAV
jgi:hypothetical protein